MRKTTMLAILVLLAMFVMPMASAANATIYFKPSTTIVPQGYCHTADVEVWVNATNWTPPGGPWGVNSIDMGIDYDPNCIKLVAVDFLGMLNWTMTSWNASTSCYGPGRDYLKLWTSVDHIGDFHACTLTFHCNNSSCLYCETNLNFTTGVNSGSCPLLLGSMYNGGTAVPSDSTNGTFACGNKPLDLNVTDVYFNPGDTRANETLRVYVNQSNDITAIVRNNGLGVVADDFDVCFEVDGNQIDCVTVDVSELPGGSLGSGAETAVDATWTPDCADYPVPGYPVQGLPFTINVTADCNCSNCPNCPDGTCGKINESDEANNRLSKHVPVIQDWGGVNRTGGVVTNHYKSMHCDCDPEDPLSDYWVVYNGLHGGGLEWNVTGIDATLNNGSTATRVHSIAIPGDTVKKAMLFVYWRDYWTNTNAYPSGCLADLSANMSSVCGTSPGVMPIEATYYDTKGFGKYNSPMGVYIYNVTDLVCANGGSPVDYTVNVTNIDPSNKTKLMGEMLVVVYEGDGSSDLVDIWINEGTDYLMAADGGHGSGSGHGSYGYHVSPAEATATILFSGTDTIPANLISANLTTVVGNGMSAGSNLLFNGNVRRENAWNGTYEAYPGSKIEVEEVDVTSNFAAGSTNSMGFMDNTSNGFYAFNVFFEVTRNGNVEIGIDQPTYVDPQSQFTINITVDPLGNEVSAVQYDLYYNRSVVWAEWANPGPFLNGTWDTDVVVLEIDNTFNTTHGKITYAQTTLGDGSGDLPYVTEKGIITTIHFSAIGVRNTSTGFNFNDVNVSNNLKDPVDYEATDCGVTIYNNLDPVANGTSMYLINNVASKFQCFAVLCPCLSHGGGDTWWGENITYIRWDFGDGQYGTSEGVSLTDPCNVKEHEYTTWNWNGTGYDPFEAYLTVRDDGEPQLSNTTSVFVQVYIAGDTNGDGVVDIFDAACVGRHFNQKATKPTEPCDPYWDELQKDEADLNNDGRVTTLDSMIVGTNWNHLAYAPYYQE